MLPDDCRQSTAVTKVKGRLIYTRTSINKHTLSNISVIGTHVCGLNILVKYMIIEIQSEYTNRRKPGFKKHASENL